MKAKINLATKRIVQVKKLRKFFLSSIIFFSISTGITLILLLINFSINLQISKLNEQQAAMGIEAGRYKSVKEMVLGTQERLGQIRSVLSERHDAGSKINAVVGIIPSSIQIKSMEYDENEIRLTLSSDSLVALQNLIEEKLPQLQNEGSRDIGSITVGDFRVDVENLAYTTSLSIAQVANVKSAAVKKEINKDE